MPTPGSGHWLAVGKIGKRRDQKIDTRFFEPGHIPFSARKNSDFSTGKESR